MQRLRRFNADGGNGGYFAMAIVLSMHVAIGQTGPFFWTAHYTVLGRRNYGARWSLRLAPLLEPIVGRNVAKSGLLRFQTANLRWLSS